MKRMKLERVKKTKRYKADDTATSHTRNIVFYGEIAQTAIVIGLWRSAVAHVGLFPRKFCLHSIHCVNEWNARKKSIRFVWIEFVMETKLTCYQDEILLMLENSHNYSEMRIFDILQLGTKSMKWNLLFCFPSEMKNGYLELGLIA